MAGSFFIIVFYEGDKDMAINVCRPIILYNDFLPPDTKPHENWAYLAFGYFDGISVGDNLFKGNDVSLEQLWEYDLAHTAERKGGYSSQILYGFRYEEENDVRDEIFWKNALKEKAIELITEAIDEMDEIFMRFSEWKKNKQN